MKLECLSFARCLIHFELDVVQLERGQAALSYCVTAACVISMKLECLSFARCLMVTHPVEQAEDPAV
jgi:hypothetical protein